MFNDIDYETKATVTAEELQAFYARQRQCPSHSSEQIGHMLDGTFCVVTARRHGELVGFARGVLSGASGSIAECKLDPVCQGPACVTKKEGRIEHDDSGIAREMASRVIECLRGENVEKINILAHGTEVDFCQELGFVQAKGVVWMELPASAQLTKKNIAVSTAAV